MTTKDESDRFQALVRFVGKYFMTNDLSIFHFDEDRPSFEGYSKDNGFKYWLASDLSDSLGYASHKAIGKAVNQALAACAALGIPINENFEEVRSADGTRDWKLSRFACYLTVMNGDARNKSVAAAQAYFITMAEAFRQYVQEAEDVERVLIRNDISEREKALSGTASSHGVVNYPFFQNAGYRGLYNMDMAQLRSRKGLPGSRSPLDFMGKTELAANLFRITQTDEKIRNDGVRGQRQLESTAETVGKAVRKTMLELSGTRPENLPTASDIQKVKSGLKRAHKEYTKLDKPKR